VLHGLQQMMVRWEELHPFHAVQIARLGDVQTSVSSLTAAIERAVRELPATEAFFSRDRRCLEWGRHLLPTVECRRVRLCDSTELAACVEEELAMPLEGACVPFRFRILTNEEETPLAVALTYRHAVSDAQGIAVLLSRVLQHAFLEDVAPWQWKLKPQAVDELFSGQRTVNGRSTSLSRSLRRVMWFRPCSGPVKSRHNNLEAGAFLLPENLSTEVVLERARASGGTVQELLFAATLKALHRVALGGQRAATLAVNTLVDLRRFRAEETRDSFGLYLGVMNVKSQVSDDATLGELLGEVRSQVRANKEGMEFLEGCRDFGTMAGVWDRLPRWVNRRLGPKLFPFAAGISNVRLNGAYDVLASRGIVADYTRGTSLGLLLPIMITVTTCGSQVTLGATYRKAAFSVTDVEQILRLIRTYLSEAVS